jgi:Fe-S cluster biogenesis protein NfuA
MPKVVNVEPTPNPDALKFAVRERLLTKGVRSFKDFEEAVGDALGSAIFALGGVVSVFYTDAFVTVNKSPSASWTDLIDPVCEAIEECNLEKLIVYNDSDVAKDSDVKFQKIMEVVNNQIRPGLAGDGGGVEIISFDGQILTIAYQGACGSCPAAGTGTLQYIEGLLQQEVDPLIRVVIS